MKGAQTQPTNCTTENPNQPPLKNICQETNVKIMVFLSKECSLIEKIISYNWEIAEGTNVTSMCLLHA